MRFPTVRRAYTLVELMIVIAIIGILSVIIYAPYSYYQDIARVRNTTDRIMQTFSDAKIAAISGLSFPGVDENYDIAVILEKKSQVVKTVWIIPGKSLFDTASVRDIRKLDLERNVSITSFSGASDLPNRIEIRFASATGLVKFFRAEEWQSETEISGFSWGIVSLGGASSGPLAIPFTFKTY